MRELDGILMDEQEKLADAAATSDGGTSGGTSGGIRSGSGNGSGSGSTSSGSNTGETSGGSSGGSSGGASDGSSGGAVGGGGVGGGDAGAPAPDDVGDGSDDDIIARQLREAAMAEEDPELREKLWQEYRDYKASVTGQSSSSTGEN